MQITRIGDILGTFPGQLAKVIFVIGVILVSRFTRQCRYTEGYFAAGPGRSIQPDCHPLMQHLALKPSIITQFSFHLLQQRVCGNRPKVWSCQLRVNLPGHVMRLLNTMAARVLLNGMNHTYCKTQS